MRPLCGKRPPKVFLSLKIVININDLAVFLVRPSMLNLRFTADVGVGISGACELPLAWRAHKPLPWALRSSAALALGLAMPHALATELVFWHRASDCAPKGCGLLFPFLYLLYLFVSFCICW